MVSFFCNIGLASRPGLQEVLTTQFKQRSRGLNLYNV